jgi:DNA helicase HerA-like ATPase
MYGDVGSTAYDVAVSDPGLKRLDYVEAEHQGARVLGIVETVTRRSDLSYEDALAGGAPDAIDRLLARVHVIGYRDASGRVQVPRTPFSAGATVRAADEALIIAVLGLSKGGAYIGHVKGVSVPVHLSLNMLAQKHLSVLAKTGAGKSYTVGVILEEFLKAQVPMVILDPHGEYGSLRHPNVDDRELGAMVRFGVKPKNFQRQIREYAIDTRLNPEAEQLKLEGVNLEAREIVDILPTKIGAGQVGVLYQAVKDVQDHTPAYTLQDVMEAVTANKSSAKWSVLNALEALQATKVFHVRGTPMSDLVRPGQCTIINLKGVAPDIQEVVASRLAGVLWQARKRNAVPPHILVVEEAHNFCPERGVGNAVSGPILRTIASEGRKFGLGLVIVSQRPAKVDKNVLSQCNTQVVLKVTNPNDLKAIVASVEGITSETADEIQRLAVGVALIAGGGLTQPVFVDVRPRLTRHGGASIDVVENGRAVPFVEEGDDEFPDEVLAPETPVVAGALTGAGPAGAADAGPGWTWDALRPARPATALPARNASMESPAWPPVSPAAPKIAAPASPPFASPAPSAARRAAPPAPAPAPTSLSRSPPPAPTARPASAPEPAIPRLTSADQRGILRVVQRLGLTTREDPAVAVHIIADLARADGRPPADVLREYVQIAQTVCVAEEPFCIRCPLRAECAYHVALQDKRQKARGVIRRLWRRA